jgi:predicted nucleic acid-binding protein
MSRFVIDTNILLRLAVAAHLHHRVTMQAVGHLRRGGWTAVLLPQVVYEFWAVATRTVAANGLGLNPAIVNGLLDDILAKVPLLADDLDLFVAWRRLARTYSVSGVNSHDMRIVAAMLRHDVSGLLTANPRDFGRYSGLQVMTPEEVLASAGG